MPRAAATAGRLVGRRNFNSSEASQRQGVLAVAAAASVLGCLAYCKEQTALEDRFSVRQESKRMEQLPLACAPTQLAKRKKALPTVPLSEVQADHGEGVCWVTYRGGVYDVTAFLEAHPGGSARIEMVNGADLESYWKVYDFHNSRPHIQQLMEEYRIGNLSAADAKKSEALSKDAFSSYYENDPERPRADQGDLRVTSVHPWNSEPLMHKLVESFFTPNDLFFVRNHNNVPDIKEEEWSLEIGGNPDCNMKDISFTLEELKTKFEKVDVVSTLQCAGNRQEDFIEEDRPLYVAPHWRGGAIGCAKWSGVRVRDLLGAAGMDVDGMSLGRVKNPKAKIVNFEGLDEDETGIPYAGVIPVEKALDPFGDAIIAYEMNGEELPRDHGYPVRLMAPGTGGCRNVKWIRHISVSERPSELDSGSKLDRHFSPAISWTSHREHCAEDTAAPHWKSPIQKGAGDNTIINLDQGPVIQSMPVQSLICYPPNRAEIAWDGESIEVKGVAYAGGGRGVCRVEVSIDGGENFHAAEMVRAPADDSRPPAEMAMGRNWAWVQFSQRIPLSADMRALLRKGQKVPIEVCSKAIDGDFNTQPERMGTSWNVLGICVNHWHRFNYVIDPKLPASHVPAAPPMPAPGSHIWPKV